MKFLVTLCVVLSVGSYVQASFIQPYEVHAHISNFALQLATAASSVIGTDSEVCYTDFQSEVNNAATYAKNQTEICISTADTDRKQYIADAQTVIANISAAMAEISKEVSTCSEYDIPEMLSCLNEWTTKLSDETALLNATSQQLQQNLTIENDQIETDETTCINLAISESKNDTQNAYEELSNCLIFGTTTEATTVTEEDTTVTDEATTEETTLAPTEDNTAETTESTTTQSESTAEANVAAASGSQNN